MVDKTFKADVTSSPFKADVTSSPLAAEISDLSLKLSVQVGFFVAILRLQLEENSLASDVFAAQFQKVLSEVSSTLDSLNVAFQKAASDDLSAEEQVVISYAKSILEQYSADEAITVSLGKSVSEAFSLGDDLSSIDIEKALTDVVGVSELLDRNNIFTLQENNSVFATDDVDGEASILDDQEISFFKSKSELTRAIEAHSFALETSRRDDFSASDAQSLGVGKSEQETISQADAAAYALSKLGTENPSASDRQEASFAKSLEHGAAALAAASITISKSLKEAILVADSANLVNAQNRPLGDTVNVTDDVDGETSILDDQEINFFKAKVDIASATEQFSRVVSYVREFSEENFASDSATLQYAKAQSETVSGSEQTTLSMLKSLSEVSSPVDAIAVAYAKGFTHQTSALDAPKLSISKAFSETVAFSDSLTALRAFLRDEQDDVFATDDIDGEASILDDQEITFFKIKTDIARAVENFERVVTYVRTFQDSASAAEVVSNALGKAIGEISVLSEAHELSLAKNVSHAAQSQEASLYNLSKPVSDDASLADPLLLQFAKALLEQPVADENLEYFMSKGLQDTGLSQDAPSKTLQKAVSDVVAVAESRVDNISYGRAVDGADGEASMTDDQSLSISKAISDLPSVAESIAFVISFVRSFSDSAASGEELNISLAKSLDEAGQVSEQISTTYGKALGETFPASEALEYAFAKALTSSGSALEAIASLIGKGLSENGTAAEVIALEATKPISNDGLFADGHELGLSKPVSDAGSAAEVLGRVVSFSRAFADTIFATDDVDGNASILDDQEMLFFKIKNDSGFASENKVLSAGKVSAENLSLADDGVLLSQGYTNSMTYFLDDYVGSKRSF